MHPIDDLFDELYRSYWGIPPVSEKRKAARRDRLAMLGFDAVRRKRR